MFEQLSTIYLLNACANERRNRHDGIASRALCRRASRPDEEVRRRHVFPIGAQTGDA